MAQRRQKRHEYAERLYAWLDEQPDCSAISALRVLVRACEEGWRESAGPIMDHAASGYPSRNVMVERLGEALVNLGGEYLHEAWDAITDPKETP